MIQDVLHDVRYALRLHRKTPALSLIAVLTLALGIGANTAIFSIASPLLFRKLPVANPDQLVHIGYAGSLRKTEISEVEAFRLYSENAKAFSDVIAFASVGTPEIVYGENTEQASGEAVSQNYFSALGIVPAVGRLFDRDSQTQSTSIVLSFGLWQRVFGGQADAVGKGVLLNHAQYTVIGVAPASFFGMTVGESPDFYLPLRNSVASPDWVTVVGRLKAGVSLAAAEANLLPIFERVKQQSQLPPDEIRQDMERLVLTPVPRGVSEVRERLALPARILLLAVALVLLIACANVASLLLAHNSARLREFTVRQALGAGRVRIIRQLLTEVFFLAVAGTILGVFAQIWVSRLLLSSLSTVRDRISLHAGLTTDVLAFSAGTMLLAVLLAGILPALFVARWDISNGLKTQSSPTSGSLFRSGMSGFVVMQLAFSVVLLSAAGLLLHSLLRMERVNVGMDRNHVVVADLRGTVSLPAPRAANFYQELLASTASLPDVRSASVSSFAPISGPEMGINVRVEGYQPRPGEELHTFLNSVAPGYFTTMQIPLLAGRDFDSHDGLNSPRVAIINKTMAAHFFGGSDPIGKQVKTVEGNRLLQVIGVVGDAKYNDIREQTPDCFYLDFNQSAPTAIRSSLLLRVSGAPSSLLAGSLRQIVRSLDPSVQVARVETMREEIDESIHQDRLLTGLCTAFSSLALLLTGIGLFGTLSFSVASRRNELGVRMALGAMGHDIFSLIVGQALRVTAIGLLAGIAGSLAVSIYLKSLLFEVSPTDPLAYAAVAVLLLIAAGLASYLPARRAMHVDPVESLRYQ